MIVISMYSKLKPVKLVFLYMETIARSSLMNAHYKSMSHISEITFIISAPAHCRHVSHLNEIRPETEQTQSTSD